jgi:hypothetical protein
MSLIVIGATSQIAAAVAKEFYSAGHDLVLFARDIKRIGNIEFEGSIDGPRIVRHQGNVSELESAESMAKQVVDTLGDNPYVLVAVGAIEGDKKSEISVSRATRIVDVNFRNLVALISPIAEALEKKRKGCLVIISSVSGDRGRQSNYIYGSAKAGLSAYAQGLRNRLFASGVHVLTVKPGYVDTPMLKEALGERYDRVPRFLIGDPDKVGKRIYRAAVMRKNIIYVGPIWRLLMFIICIIPESIFKRLHM